MSDRVEFEQDLHGGWDVVYCHSPKDTIETHYNVFSYENADWVISAPLLPPDEPLDLPPELIEETLNYFILCADRLSQMTRTYNDTDALTRLLEEKERDLELAAHIGKSLLEEKRSLTDRIEQLEIELTSQNEVVTQLRHDLCLKNSLLLIYQEGDDESPCGERPPPPTHLDALQKKITELETENGRLKVESQHWSDDLAAEEERESELISECVRELGESQRASAQLQDELTKKAESAIKQQEEISSLLGQLVDLQKKVREYSIENEALRMNLDVMGDTQQELTSELSEFKEKYNQLLCAFQELQEEFRKRNHRNSGSLSTGTQAGGKSWQGAYGAYTKYINPDSLAAELSMSLRTDNSEGYHSDDRPATSTASQPSPSRPPSAVARRTATTAVGTGHGRGNRPTSGEFGEVTTSDDGESLLTDSYHTDDDSQYSSLSSVGNTHPMHGKPMIPHELDLRSPRAPPGMIMSHSRSFYTDLEDDPTSRCRTPDSILSYNGFGCGSSSSSVRRYRMPDKLQIIKPLEGSQTLHKWRKLATPTPLGLIGIEEKPEGVKLKSAPKTPPPTSSEGVPLKNSASLDVASFLEEMAMQEEPVCQPGKSFQQSSCIYTFSTSNVLHPDATNVTNSLQSVKMSTCAGLKRSPPQTTASVISRSSYLATSTCSVNRGLARLLNERGIHAMLPTVLLDKEEDDDTLSSTSTPAPSPDQTPPGTPPNESAEDIIPDLVKENRAKGIVLRSYRIEGKSSAPVAVRRSSASSVTRSSKRGSQELDTQSLMTKLSRLVAWPFAGFVEPNSLPTITTTAQTSTATTISTSTMSDSISSVIPIISSAAMSSSPSSCSVTFSTQTTSSSSQFQPPQSSHSPSQPWGFVPPSGFGTGSASTLSPSMRLPLYKTPNPLVQLNMGRGRPIGTVGSIRTMRKGAYM